LTRSTEWLSRWIYFLAASFYYLAVFLRSWLIYNGTPTNLQALSLLLAWLVLAASEAAISRRWRFYFPIYLLIQTGIVFTLLNLPRYPDFYAALLAVLSMQAMLRLKTWIVGVWIGLCAVFMFWTLLEPYGAGQAAALALIFAAGNVFVGAYTLTMRRAHAEQEKNQALVLELDQANQQLQAYSAQLEQLAVARERNRLARDLHDSVTQTVFSMTLTAQSALLLLERNPSQVGAQLDRLYQLARSAMAEMQVLIAELKPEPGAGTGLEATLRGYIHDSRFTGNLSISLVAEGEGRLSAAEQEGLFRIAQEALNNTLKHARASQAQIHLHLEEPFWMEIADQGQGFEPQQAAQSGKVGLASMRERAAEIGWGLQISSAPGAGARIRVEKSPAAEDNG
jgi:signal transduction histidine kinase